MVSNAEAHAALTVARCCTHAPLANSNVLHGRRCADIGLAARPLQPQDPKTSVCEIEALVRHAQVDDTIVTWQRPDHPHNSAEFAAHTGLTHYYPKYMVGGGYVVSADVAKMIVATHQLVCGSAGRLFGNTGCNVCARVSHGNTGITIAAAGHRQMSYWGGGSFQRQLLVWHVCGPH